MVKQFPLFLFATHRLFHILNASTDRSCLPLSFFLFLSSLSSNFAKLGVGYSFSADWDTVGKDQEDGGASLVYVSNITSPDRSTNNVLWHNFHYPNTVNNSANSVFYNTTLAFFETPEQIYAHGFVAEFTFASVTSGDGSNSNALLSTTGVIAVSVVGGVLGLALIALVVYFVVVGGGAFSASRGKKSVDEITMSAGGTTNPIGVAHNTDNKFAEEF